LTSWYYQNVDFSLCCEIQWNEIIVTISYH
jgi:hypothetical protein